ncbi:MAG: bifunctional adenosylcobinamide kinase/adenosylcobinamide-phosphate guanylyltransferase [Gudongella sp.]|nr:bifunctional adenosylcobinamide kinase/adenosylcobinamide-phosphate guanylyltransferase [Gudongella sp.]
MILVTGGARSGKSNFAQSLFDDDKDVVYIATSRIEDSEMDERVLLHKANRPNEWRTFEGTYDLELAVGEEKKYLLDCLTVLTSNIMFDLSKDMEHIDMEVQNKVENTTVSQITKLYNKLEKIDGELVLVTNELGYSLVPENHVGRVFRDIQGRVNQRIATLSNEVYLVCCGIPVKIK